MSSWAVLLVGVVVTAAVMLASWATRRPKPIACSFCGSNQDQARKLVAGPGVYICDRCIHLCYELVTAERPPTPGPPDPDPFTPPRS